MVFIYFWLISALFYTKTIFLWRPLMRFDRHIVMNLFPATYKYSWMSKLYNVNSYLTRHYDSCQPTATNLWEEDSCHVSYLFYGFCSKWYSFNTYYFVEWTYINLVSYKLLLIASPRVWVISDSFMTISSTTLRYGVI